MNLVMSQTLPYLVVKLLNEGNGCDSVKMVFSTIKSVEGLLGISVALLMHLLQLNVSIVISTMLMWMELV